MSLKETHPFAYRMMQARCRGLYADFHSRAPWAIVAAAEMEWTVEEAEMLEWNAAEREISERADEWREKYRG